MRFSVIVERDKDGLFNGSIPELPGCHTQAKTIDELMDRIKEAAALYLEVEETREKMEFVGIQFIEIPPHES